MTGYGPNGAEVAAFVELLPKLTPRQWADRDVHWGEVIEAQRHEAWNQAWQLAVSLGRGAAWEAAGDAALPAARNAWVELAVASAGGPWDGMEDLAMAAAVDAALAAHALIVRDLITRDQFDLLFAPMRAAGINPDLLVPNAGETEQDADESVSARATAIAAGSFHTLALNSDGTVVAWGLNDSGQCDVPAGLAGVTAIAANGRYNLALTRDGTVEAWGEWGRGTVKRRVEVPDGLSRVTAVATGKDHALALIDDGTVVAWGDNQDGPCDVPPSLTGVVKIAAGGHSLALTSTGVVVAWGDSNWRNETIAERLEDAQLGDVFDIAADGSMNLFLLDDGTVVAWDNHADMWGDVHGGPDRGFYVPAEFSGTRVFAIATGYANHLAIRNGYVLRAQSSRLKAPIAVPLNLGRAVNIAAGDGHSVALRADGTIGAWGSNEYGQATVPARFAR